MNDDVFISLQGAKRVGFPLPDLWSTRSLSTEDVRAYWRFRLQFMDLKPHMDLEKDWAKFATWMQDADVSWLQRAPNGQLIGVLSYKMEHRVFEGRSVTLLWPEYGYVLPAAKKSASSTACMLFALASCLFKHPRAPIYIVGTAYLSSFVALTQIAERGWLHDEPSMSAWERRLWQTLAESTAGYDPVRKIVNMGTIPRNPRTSAPKNPHMVATWQRYLAHNPAWTEGYTCLCMWPVRLSVLANSARRIGG